MQEKAPLSHGFGISQEDSSNDYSVELRFQVLWVVVFADGDERKRIWERKNWGRSQKRLSSLAPTATNNTPRYENVAMKKKERRDWTGEMKRTGNNKKDYEKRQRKGTTSFRVKDYRSSMNPSHGVQPAMVLPYLVSTDWYHWHCYHHRSTE